MKEKLKNVEDIYPVSPMQEVMLLHTISKSSNDVLFNQFCYEIRGDLDIRLFQASWQQLLDRHTALRTAFVWQGLKQPVQVVRKELKLPFEHLDWREFSEQEQRFKFDEYCQQDRDNGFDVSNAPLMRIALMQCGNDKSLMLWSSHHLLLDRWCLSTIFENLYEYYTAGGAGDPARSSRSRPFSDYVKWVGGQDSREAESYWRSELRGIREPTEIVAGKLTSDRGPQQRAALRKRVALSLADSESLRAFARSNGLTLSTVIQGAWALLANSYCGRQDIVFGAAVSGRPPELDGVEDIVGSFVNNVPVRVQLAPGKALVEWLQELQIAQQKRSLFEYVSLADIQRWSEVPANRSLFDTLLVWLSGDGIKVPEGLTVEGIRAGLTTAYPLTLGISSNSGPVSVEAYQDTRYSLVAELPEMLQRFASMLRSVAGAEKYNLIANMEGFRAVSDKSLELASCDRKNSPVLDFTNDDGKVSSASSPAGREGLSVELLEELLVAEFRIVLGIDDVNPDDNFFDLGGSSLQAARLQAAIEIGTRKLVPLLNLFLEPTIRQMATMLYEEKWPLKPDLLVPLRTYGAKEPLFCVASPEVNTIGYVNLSRHMDEDRPVYVLQASPDSDAVRRLAPDELPGMAARYIVAMRKAQRNGPYFLLGMCTGAQLACEMARQLSTAGEKLSFVGIVNTWGFYTVSKRYYFTKLLNRLGWYTGRVRLLCQKRPGDAIVYMRQVLRKRTESAKATIRPVFATGSAAAAIEATEVSNDWIESVGWSWKEQAAPKYDGAITVFRIRRQPYWRVRDPTLGWGKQAEKISIRHLPGSDHNAILRETQIKPFVENLQDCLSGAAD